ASGKCARRRGWKSSIFATMCSRRYSAAMRPYFWGWRCATMIIKAYEHHVMSREEFDMIKITRQIAEDVADSGVQNGLAFVISLHTTTGIMINESLPCVEK